MLILLIATTTIYFVLQDGLLAFSRSCKSLKINKAGECVLILKDEQSLKVQIMPDSFVSSYLTILHVVFGEFKWYKFWQKRNILLLPDNIDAQSFRELRVYLRWHKNAVNLALNSAD